MFPIMSGFYAGAPTDLIADSIAQGDRWEIIPLDYIPAARPRAIAEVQLADQAERAALKMIGAQSPYAALLGPAVES